MVRSHVGLWVGLATLAPVPHPAVHIPANSEQRQPLELGSSASGAARLPAVLRARLQTSLNRSAHLGAEVELWPTRNLDGRMDWVVARERTGPAAPWRWVEGETYRWNVAKQRRAIFADVLDLADLYDKPRFGDCVFSPAGAEAEPTLAWPDPADRMRARQERLMQADLSARQK
ncbi:MAG TPA: hypothetical protein VL588_01540, partial [Bdellovibrionota bacterium]|nr:hypothetical protein [Bdellovibrionota bacterium]